MLTVALIGLDGAGKTTIANQLMESFPFPIKYLYMGMNAHSSNVALPTTRLMSYLKMRKHKKAQKKAGKPQTDVVSLHSMESRRNTRGQTGATFRLVNRIAEESYRHLVAQIFKLQKNIVLFDRYFLFDFARRNTEIDRALDERIHNWFLYNVYPKPDLVIFLDAPPEILYARKQEATITYLHRRREAYLTAGARISNFVLVDASQSVEEVYEEVANHIMQALNNRKLPKTRAIGIERQDNSTP